jgi:hypothetical protein
MRMEAVIVLLLAAAALAGCAGAEVGLRSGNPSMPIAAPPPGTAYSTASIQAEVRPNVWFGALFLGSVMYGNADEYQRWKRGATMRSPPQMDPARAIAERDCSQPLGQIYGNLRCK